MDLNKSQEFFNPENVKGMCHIIGCGSIGSSVAELLARYGIEDIHLYDFDEVEPHNIVNQMFTSKDVGKAKVFALKEILGEINPALKNTVGCEPKGYKNQMLDDYVFLCVDNVDVRREIVKNIWDNPYVKAVFDFRTTLMEGQCYYADWSNQKDKESLLESLNFTHEEAKANTPVSACGFELSVAPVVRMTAQMGIANFTNLINGNKPKHLILIQPYNYFFEAM